MLLHLDSPAYPFITCVPQMFSGWITVPAGRDMSQASLQMDGIEIDTEWVARPDVEAAHPNRAVRGFSFWFNTAAAARRIGGGRMRRLTFHMGGMPVAERRFLLARNFVKSPGRRGPIYWMHIPKTGGTSLRTFLDTIIPPERMLRIYEHQPGVPAHLAPECPQAYLDGVELIYGHYAHALHDFTQMRHPSYITVLRDPIDLVRSYIAFNPDAGDDDPFFDNPLTRYLSGEGHERIRIGPEHVAKAKANILRDFVHIGYAHELERTTAWFAGLFGLPAPDIPHINVSHRANERRQLPHFVNLEHDLALYTWCRLEDPVAAAEATIFDFASQSSDNRDTTTIALIARTG